jgi:gamma-polyglutamate biosynthesis protein CapC
MTITTTVWVGVWVSCICNLRFGWVLSGLVVPGYLVPILLMKPWAAVVIFLEAMITYCSVWTYSEYLSRFGFWNGLFGRDRFFALFLASVIVRIIMEALVLPSLGEYVNSTYLLNFDYRNNLHSFGLIIVALLANQFWKPGLIRGSLPVAATILTTYILVRYVLMEFTNFGIGNLDYIYEDVARSLLASPKAYIILLATAFIASRMNLEYGWEFSGILIPSLIALEWYQPHKVAFTFVETFIILISASLLLRLPLFRNANIEGARKILFFFNVSFAYRLMLGYLILTYFPEHKITDYYGFGYLLSTLLAIRMHDKDIAARVTRATLQTSLIAVVLASLIGFGLTYVPNYFAFRAVAGAPSAKKERNLASVRLIDEMRKEKTSMYKMRLPNSYSVPVPEDLDVFGEALHSIAAFRRTRNDDHLAAAKKLLGIMNYEVELVEGKHVLIHEREPQRGWGTYVINTSPSTDLLVEVPAPLDEWGVLEAGTWIYGSSSAQALAVAGSARRSNPDGASDVLQNPSTMFRLFQREFGQKGVLQVRGHTTETVRALSGKRPSTPSASHLPPSAESVLLVKSALPEGLDLAQLRTFIGPYRIDWAVSPFSNILREDLASGFAELVLDRREALALMFKPAFGLQEVASEIRSQSIVGYLQDWILVQKENFPDKGSNLYVQPKMEELIYLDQEVLTPLLKACEEDYIHGEWTKEGVKRLGAISSLAGALGYQLIRYRHQGTGQDYLILSEKEDLAKKRNWGTYVFRLGQARDYVVQIPRPLTEVNIFEYSVALFERLKAKVFLIGACHPLANVDGSADVVKIENKENMFNLVSQVVLREFGKKPMLAVQCRAFGYKPDVVPPEADAVIAFRSGITRREPLDALARHLLEVLEKDRITFMFADGSPSVMGYEVGGIAQSLYLDHATNKEFAVLWLSPVARPHYRQQTENRIQDQQFRALGVQTVEADLYDEIQKGTARGHSSRIPEDLKLAFQGYMESQDIVVLSGVLAQWPQLHYVRLIDVSTKQSFLLVYSSDGRLMTVANLFPRDPASSVNLSLKGDPRKNVTDYVESRTAWLDLE